MKIFSQIKNVLAEQEDSIFSTSQIITLVSNKFGTNKSSIIPSDYCYNRINKGIKFDQHILIMLSPGEYKFVGENYPYSGWIYQKTKKSNLEEIVGQWKNGKYNFFKPIVAQSSIKDETIAPQKIDEKQVVSPQGNLHIEQIEKLYEEYLSLLELEVNVFGCKPTETRHLIGRIGEFKCALVTNGSLAKKSNQHGFDVISEKGIKISVKTTAQKVGFVSINKNTIHKVDELMIIQYKDRDFIIIYHGPIEQAVEYSRIFNNKYEFDISKAERLQRKKQTE